MNNYIFTLITFLLFTFQIKAENTRKITENTPWGKEVFEIPQFTDTDFSIVDFGAVSGGKVDNQNGIQLAIDACNKAGGGRVVIPSGTWMTSFINFKSNVNLHLEEGAVLLFSDDIKKYMVSTFTRWEGFECMNYHPLIYARNCQNIAITGKGKIDGNGSAWWFMKKKQKVSLSNLYQQVINGVKPEKRNLLNYEQQSMLRPSLIQFIDCKNILLKDIEVSSGPMWTVHMIYSKNIIAQNIRVITEGVNNDGIIPDSCEKMLIDNCYFSTGDDCIVIKSGLNEDGWRVAKPSQRIIVKNCNTHHGHGGIVLGSEMSGGINRVYAYNCNFSNTERGIRIKSMIGRGGLIENIWFENIIMNNIKKEAIKLNMHYESSSITPKSDKRPIFRNFYFKNIISDNSNYALFAKGIDDQLIADMQFKNIKMESKHGVKIMNADNFAFKNIDLETKDLDAIQIQSSHSISFRKLDAKSLNQKSNLVIKNKNEVIIEKSVTTKNCMF